MFTKDRVATIREVGASICLGLGLLLLLWAASSLAATTYTSRGNICGKAFRAVWFTDTLINGGEVSSATREQSRAECREDGQRIVADGQQRAIGGAVALAVGGVLLFGPWRVRAGEASNVS